MNKDEALKQFIEQNFHDLLGVNFTRKDFKKLENAFFYERHRNKFGRYKMNEVLEQLVRFMKGRGIQRDRVEQYITELPVFRDASENLLDQLLNVFEQKDVRLGIQKEDLETIQSVGSFEAVRRFHKAEIETELYRELESVTQDIAQKRAEYDTLPSILERETIQEPEFDPKLEDIKPWWERFYLKQDPFARKDGLSDVSQDLYEEVLVKTTPFQTTLSSLNRNPNYLFRTGFLLVGDYGFGKTTFIDYLSYYLIQKDVLPIRVTCGKPFPDSTGFISSFYLRLRNQLKEEFIKITSDSTDFLNDLDIEEEVKVLCERILTNRRKGIVVFLDDYHKHRSHFSYIFEFLGILQILKDELTRANLDVGFLVSGISAWKEELSRNGQMSGFLDNTPIEMPNITPELVCDVFNQRIQAYCYDRSPRQIKVEFVKRMFKEVEGRAGFRDYLTRIVSELSNNNLSIVNTPIEVSEEILGKIKSELENDPTLRSSINNLAYRSKFQRYTQEQIAKCFELLIQISIHDGIAEDDQLFIDNKFYFQYLRETGLIQKSKLKLQSSTAPGKNKERGQGQLQWVLRTNLQDAVNRIFAKYGFGINDYLLKLYGWKDPERSTTALENKMPTEYAEFQAFFGRQDLNLPKSASDSINLAFHLFEPILLTDGSSSGSPELIKKGFDAFTELSSAYFQIDNSNLYFRDANIYSVDQKWRLHYSDDESILELLSRVNDYNSDRTKLKFNLALKQLKDVFAIVARKLKDVIEDMRFGSASKGGGLIGKNVLHTPEELKIFEEVRRSFHSLNSSDHFDYVKRLTDHLELKFRMFLYVTTFLIFGERYINYLPEALKEYAHRSLTSRNNYTLFINGFNGLTRPQFRQIFTQNNKIKELIIDQLDTVWKNDDWKTFFDTFIVENIATAHQQRDSYSPLERDRYANYAKMAEELCAAMNKLARTVPTQYSWIIKESPGSQPEEFVFKHATKIGNNLKELQTRLVTEKDEAAYAALSKPVFADHRLSSVSYNRVIGLILQKIGTSVNNCLIEDLLGVEYITNNYNVRYEEFMHSILFGHFVSQNIVIHNWFGSSILIRKRDTGNGRVPKTERI